jgi:hypothetical protein
MTYEMSLDDVYGLRSGEKHAYAEVLLRVNNKVYTSFNVSFEEGILDDVRVPVIWKQNEKVWVYFIGWYYSEYNEVLLESDKLYINGNGQLRFFNPQKNTFWERVEI